MAARQYKIILIGDAGVGKTSYFQRIRNGNFDETELRATILSGVECLEHTMKIDDQEILVRLHDTGGGERFRTLTSNFYRNADAAILMFSVEDQYTFENLQEWYENASEVLPDIDNFVWGVVGNKCDLTPEVEEDSVAIKCEQIGTELIFSTSAKTGEMVLESFEAIIREVHKRALSRRPTGLNEQSTVKITPGKPPAKKSGCC